MRRPSEEPRQQFPGRSFPRRPQERDARARRPTKEAERAGRIAVLVLVIVIVIAAAAASQPRAARAQEAEPPAPVPAGAGEQAPEQAPEPPEEVRAFLRAWAERMRGVETLRVEFTQTKELRVLRRPRVSRGFALLRGRRLLLVVLDAQGERDVELLVSEREVRIHYPRLRRVEVLALDGTAPPAGTTPFPMFGADVEALPETYAIELRREERGDLLVLRPHDERTEMREMRMLFRDHTPIEVTQENRRGDRVRLEITRFDTGADVPEESVRLNVPAGTEEVRISVPGSD